MTTNNSKLNFNDDITSCGFGLPEDFPTLVDSVVDSLEEGNQDYCFNKKQLAQITKLCHNKGISFVYKIFYNDIFSADIDYIKITPVIFYVENEEIDKNNFNLQYARDEVPLKYKYVRVKTINRGSTEVTDDANYFCSRGMEIVRFNDDGTPVWQKKISWNSIQKKNKAINEENN